MAIAEPSTACGTPPGNNQSTATLGAGAVSNVVVASLASENVRDGEAERVSGGESLDRLRWSRYGTGPAQQRWLAR